MHQLKAAKKAGDLWLICDGERREGRDLGAAAVGGLGLGAARPPVARMKTRAGSITSLIGGPTHRAPLGRDPWPQSAEQRAWRRGPSERPSMHMRLKTTRGHERRRNGSFCLSGLWWYYGPLGAGVDFRTRLSGLAIGPSCI
jgi:hypothetical protein